MAAMDCAQVSGSRDAGFSGMRTIVVLLIATGLGILFYHQKQVAPINAQPASPAATTKTAPANPAQPPPATTSEHNWMKRSLDRATEVRNAARAQTKQS